MKNLLTIFTLVFLSQVSRSQSFDDYCTVDRFKAMIAYYQPNGAGIEIGLWPQDKKVGVFLGAAILSKKIMVAKSAITPPEETKTVEMRVYVKPVLRINRFVYLTATAGLKGTDKGYLMAGMRLSVPVNTGSRFTFILEPQYGTDQFTVQAGVGVSL